MRDDDDDEQIDLPFGVQDEPSGLEEGLAALARAAAVPKNAAMIAQMIPIARRLAREAWPKGITCTELRKAAFNAGLLTGQERGKTLSYLGAVMKSAGLRGGEMRRSPLTVTHGHAQIVWYATEPSEVLA